MYNTDNILGLIIGIIVTTVTIYLYKLITKPKFKIEPKQLVSTFTNFINNPENSKLFQVMINKPDTNDPEAMYRDLLARFEGFSDVMKKLH